MFNASAHPGGAWVNVPQGNASIYSSLVGLPILGKTSFGNGSLTLITTYWYADCYGFDFNRNWTGVEGTWLGTGWMWKMWPTSSTNSSSTDSSYPGLSWALNSATYDAARPGPLWFSFQAKASSQGPSTVYGASEIVSLQLVHIRQCQLYRVCLPGSRRKMVYGMDSRYSTSWLCLSYWHAVRQISETPKQSHQNCAFNHNFTTSIIKVIIIEYISFDSFCISLSNDLLYIVDDSI